MEEQGNGYAEAQGRASFYESIKAGDYVEVVRHDGDNWTMTDGRAVHATKTHIWWAETGREKKLRKAHRYRCTPVPSPEQVAERAAAIRATWTPAEVAKRGKSLQTAIKHICSDALYKERKEEAEKYIAEQKMVREVLSYTRRQAAT
tara:strand:+ start:29649 stop:30089 length:441 start_codon:yes stop_codon:yes gene_type:complete